jgi:hypothetical protein
VSYLIAIVVIAALIALGVWLGIWGSKRLGYTYWSRSREERREARKASRGQLTRGERIVGMLLALAPAALAVGGIIVLVNGSARGVGIALLVLALGFMALPISPVLRARVRRREARVWGQRGEKKRAM